MSGQKVAKFFALWVLVPAGLGALGYFVVGPMLMPTEPVHVKESDAEALKRELEEANQAEQESAKPKGDRSYAR